MFTIKKIDNNFVKVIFNDTNDAITVKSTDFFEVYNIFDKLSSKFKDVDDLEGQIRMLQDELNKYEKGELYDA